MLTKFEDKYKYINYHVINRLYQFHGPIRMFDEFVHNIYLFSEKRICTACTCHLALCPATEQFKTIE